VKRAWERLRRAMRSEGRVVLKLSVYAVGCLLVLGWLVSIVGNTAFFADRSGYEAELDDATGLRVNDAVKIAGVEVGAVTGIEIEQGHAVVSFEIDDGTVLPSTTRSGVRWRSVLGQKYLYLYPGEGGEPLEPGDRIPLEQSVPSADVGDFLNALGPVLQAIDPDDANAFVQAVSEGVSGNEAQIRSLIDDSSSLATVLGGLDGEVGSVITNLDDVAGALAERDDAVDELLVNLSSLSGDLAVRNDSLNSLITDFGDVQDRLERLLRENRGDLDGTIDDLRVIADSLAAHDADLEGALATLPEGVAPYHLISSTGQWFGVRATVACLANQTSCSFEDPAHAFSGASGPETLTGPEQGPSVADIVAFANAGAPA
jgi:phospholipid/cholesterol/gamma-HCH transport system substrate-binding protein